MNDVFQAGTEIEKIVADIHPAAFVYCRGVQLVTVTRDRRGSSVFIFNNADSGADRALREYYSGALISGRELMEALHALKKESNAAARPS